MNSRRGRAGRRRTSSPRPKVPRYISAVAQPGGGFRSGCAGRLLAGALIPASMSCRRKIPVGGISNGAAAVQTVDAILAPATPCRRRLVRRRSSRWCEAPVRANLGLSTQPISFIGLPVVAVPLPARSAAGGAAPANWRADHHRPGGAKILAYASLARSKSPGLLARPGPIWKSDDGHQPAGRKSRGRGRIRQIRSRADEQRC